MKRTCNLIYAYQNKQLGPDENRFFEEHLKNCSRCQEKLEALKSFDEFLRENLEQVSSQPDLNIRNRIIRKVEEKFYRSRRKNSLLWRLGYSLSLAFILFSAITFSLIGGEISPAVTPGSLTLKEAGGPVLPSREVDSQGNLMATPFSQAPSYQGLVLAQIPQDSLDTFRESFGPPLEEIGPIGVYVFSDQSFEATLQSLPVISKFRINSPVSTSLPLSEGNFLLAVASQGKEEGNNFSLFLSAWKTEMREGLSGWPLIPLLLAFIFLGLSFFKKKRVFSFLFCLFLFLAIILPSFLERSESGFLFLGNPENGLGSSPLAEETNREYNRFFFSSSEKEEILKNGFFLKTEVPPFPQALENFSWGQESAFQILAFSNSWNLVLLILTIFITKALIYFFPLVLFAISQRKGEIVVAPVP
ncbi:MAG: zf-HC2 domain-containing protein [Caldiserica bacterium]|jgi:hypothetical protein|nr:zf-HC2 domain-containing protein [Caldisericota bacterium]MDH7562745.1 zf-HC2 domain-containing protein [Caldisericota bacterium]